MIHIVKGFGIVNKTEVDVFLKLSCFFDDPTDVGNVISGSSAFSKSSLNTWKFSVHVLLKPGLENFEHYFDSVWNECHCAAVWTFFGIAFLWGWIFPVVQTVKNLPAMQETRVRSLGQGDPLEKGMAIHSSILATISTPKRWCCESTGLNLPGNLESSTVATGLEKVSFNSNPKERHYQTILPASWEILCRSRSNS